MRESTERQAGADHFGPDLQRAGIREYCERNGIPPPEREYFDAASGRSIEGQKRAIVYAPIGDSMERDSRHRTVCPAVPGRRSDHRGRGDQPLLSDLGLILQHLTHVDVSLERDFEAVLDGAKHVLMVVDQMSEVC